MVVGIGERVAGGKHLGFFHDAHEQVVAAHVDGLGDGDGEARQAVLGHVGHLRAVEGARAGGELVSVGGSVEAESADELHGRVLGEHRGGEAARLQDGGSGGVLLVQRHRQRGRLARHLHERIYHAAAAHIARLGRDEVEPRRQGAECLAINHETSFLQARGLNLKAIPRALDTMTRSIILRLAGKTAQGDLCVTQTSNFCAS